MCMGNGQVFGAFAESQLPGFSSGQLPHHQNPQRKYTWGQGFDISTTPSENLASNPAGTAEKNRRKSLTPDQYGRGLWDKEKASTPKKEDAPPPVLRNNISNGASDLKISKRKDRANKRNVASGRRTSKAKRFSTRSK